MKLIISLSIFIFCIHISLAQGFRVSSYNREDGLQSELDKSISQDALGFIWVASDEGLIRFNGFKFQLFRNELISPYCKDLVCLPDGRLYSSSDKGIMELHCSPDNVRFEVIAQTEIDSKDTLMWFPKQFSVDKKNNVWCGDQTSVYKIIGKKVERYKFPYTSYSYDWQHAASVVDDALYGILTISQTGKIFSVDTVTKLLNPWIINTQIPKVQSCLGLSPGKILVCADGKIRVLSLKKNYTATDSIIADLDASELHRTASGRIYIGTWLKGLYELSSRNFKLTKITEYPFNSVSRIHESKTGGIWVCGDNGISLLQEKVFDAPFSQITQSYIQSVYGAADGSVYFNDGNLVVKATIQEDAYHTEIVAKAHNELILQALPVGNSLFLATANGSIEELQQGHVTNKWDFKNQGRAVFYLYSDATNTLWACQDENKRLLSISALGIVKTYGIENGLSSRPIVVKANNKGNIFVGAFGDSSYLFRFNPKKEVFENLSLELSFEHSTDIVVNDFVFEANTNIIWIASSLGLLKYDFKTVELVDQGQLTYEAIKAIQLAPNGDLWYANSKGLLKRKGNSLLVFDEREGIASKNIAYRSFLIDPNNVLWVGSAAGLSVSRSMKKSTQTPRPFFIKVKGEKSENIETLHNITTEDYLNFEFVSPVFPSKSVLYEWRLSPSDSYWQGLESNKSIFIKRLPPGKYTLEIRAKQEGNFLWSEVLTYEIDVKTIWYKSYWVWLLALSFLFVFIYFIIRFNTWKLNKTNKHLEILVQQRTEDIAQQQKQLEITNESLKYQTEALDESAIVSIANKNGNITYVNSKFCEISQYSEAELIGKNHAIIKSGLHPDSFFKEMWQTIQKGKWRGEICNRKKNGELYWVDATIVPFLDETGKPYQYLAIRLDITASKMAHEQMLTQKTEIELQHKQISSSIDYAARIQHAVLRSQDSLTQFFPDNFIFLRPKHRVSGDFFWIKQVAEFVVIVAADCTGHGVPGGFMSMLGIAFLNDVVAQSGIVSPANILERLRTKIKNSLQQTGVAKEAKDGMDMSICVVNTQTQILSYAGANNPVFFIRNNEFEVLSPTKNPVGIYQREVRFAQTELKLMPGDRFYMFTDGFVDQFGGKNGDKLKKHRFVEAILKNHQHPMVEQHQLFQNLFDNWRKDFNQVDDVLLLGFTI